MANQAIALQARAPQNDFMGRAIQQNAQMMNMMSQQRAAERQAAVAQQQMEIARAGEARAAAKEGREIDDFKLKQIKEVAAYFRDALGSWAAPGDVAATQALRDDVVQMIPAWDKIIPSAQALANDPNTRQLATMRAEEIIEYTVPKPEVEVQVDPRTNRLQEVRTGGLGPRGAYELESFELDPNAGAPAGAPPPAVGGGVAAQPTRGTATGPADLLAQGVNPNSIPSGNPLQPISMTTGPQMGGQPDMTAIVQDMMTSKQISQSNLQLMREMAGPDKDQQLAQILKTNNIQIVPDEAPGMRSAVFRPGQDAAPQMQMAQALKGYRATGRAAEGKSPMLSPSQVPSAAGAVAEAQREPIPQAGKRAQAERAAPAEVEAVERAKAQADADVKFKERFPTDRDSTRQMISLINNMIGDTYVENGRLVKKGNRDPAPGFEDVVGATWRPGFRFIPGTAAADFDAKLEQIEGGTFLEAFERLKGGGQITEIEGQKATRAISRMKRSVSEVAFVEAAREFEGIVRGALKRAEERYARLQGQKPATQSATSGWGKATVVGD